MLVQLFVVVVVVAVVVELSYLASARLNKSHKHRYELDLNPELGGLQRSNRSTLRLKS